MLPIIKETFNLVIKIKQTFNLVQNDTFDLMKNLVLHNIDHEIENMVG